MKPQYVFIVGMPRTGTKLMISILERCRHSHFKFTPETFFVGRLIRPGARHQIRRLFDISNDSHVHALVDYMYSGQLEGTYWDLLKRGKLGIDRKAMLAQILGCTRSDRAIFKIIMRMHPEVTKHTIVGEKTPGHLYHVPTLLEWFPTAKIIHTFREPQAVFVSEWKRRMRKSRSRLLPNLTKAFYSIVTVLHVTATWHYAVRLHHLYKARYPQNYYLSRFEDLIREPENSIDKLCEFLDIEFDTEMLNPRKFGSSYSSEGGTGFDRQTLSRWQDNLTPWMRAWLLVWAKLYSRELENLQ